MSVRGRLAGSRRGSWRLWAGGPALCRYPEQDETGRLGALRRTRQRRAENAVRRWTNSRRPNRFLPFRTDLLRRHTRRCPAAGQPEPSQRSAGRPGPRLNTSILNVEALSLELTRSDLLRSHVDPSLGGYRGRGDWITHGRSGARPAPNDGRPCLSRRGPGFGLRKIPAALTGLLASAAGRLPSRTEEALQVTAARAALQRA